MFKGILGKVLRQMRREGSKPQPACSPQDLLKMRRRASEQFSTALPRAYCTFLTITNGLDWDGLVIYATHRIPIVGFDDRFIDGFVEANLAHRDYPVFNDLLVFGENGTVVFVFDMAHREYQVLMNIGLDVLERYSTFDKLMTNALGEHL
jgi:hypothetical protein